MPDEAFMAMRLKKGKLKDGGVLVRFHPAFHEF